MEACSAGVALPLCGYALTVDPTERRAPAKQGGSSSICLAQAGSLAEAHRQPPSSLEFEFQRKSFHSGGVCAHAPFATSSLVSWSGWVAPSAHVADRSACTLFT